MYVSAGAVPVTVPWPGAELTAYVRTSPSRSVADRVTGRAVLRVVSRLSAAGTGGRFGTVGALMVMATVPGTVTVPSETVKPKESGPT